MTENSVKTTRPLVEVQAEQIEWSIKNFGNQPAHRPLLGIIEELCELGEAYELRGGRDAVIDAIGDVGVYMLDYCGKRGWQLQDLWLEAKALGYSLGLSSTRPLSILLLVKVIAHCHLKGEQNIRGGTAVQDEKMKQALREVLLMADDVSSLYGVTFLEVLDEVWSKVRLRDWTKNPNTAHEVAAAEIEAQRGK